MKEFFLIQRGDHRQRRNDFYANIKKKLWLFLDKMTDTTFELSKMAVTNGVQGLGIGNKLLQHCLIFALESDIQKSFCTPTED
jgi:N-acetylglutamate synthase-like GNAT family acetyltransferase